MTGRAGLSAILVTLGAIWSLTHPLNKIVVTAGYQPIGIMFWQLSIGAVLTGGMLYLRRIALVISRKTFGFWLIIALIGTLLPNYASFRALFYLPAGIVSTLMAAIPMIAFPIALIMRIEEFSVIRMIGLCVGMAGVALIALPESSLPDPGLAVFLPLALLAPLFYAFEGNAIAKWGTGGQSALQLLCGASIVGAAIALPAALLTGQFVPLHLPLTTPDLAMIAAAIMHVTVYTVYIWLVGQAGAVFAAQVSYLVTGFGVLWGMILLGERYSLWVWAALLCMICGLALVQPRKRDEGTPPT